jgi:4-hydroxy-tetrahydrodipicolinate synthase
MKELGRLLTAMVTPFDPEGNVDYKQARSLAVALIKSGSDGVVVSGTTGESPTLTHDEEMQLFAEIKEAVGNRGSVIAGTGSNSTAEAIAATRGAEKLGVDACLLVTPYYNKPSQEGVFSHFKAIAESTSLPCILYNVPARTVVTLAAETAVKLSQIQNIVGIKEASGNLGEISRIITQAKTGFRVWSGNDNDTLPLMAIGGYGIISVASHLVGLQMKEMIEAYLEGRINQAMAIHLNLMPLFNALFVVSNPVPVKYALNVIGFMVGRPRLPLCEPDARSAEVIKEVLRNYKIDLPLS